ncbi:hypothetical protein L1987_45842 [Smallanthus sonchifolius]|uniref:Uncharacterized protein n=1 Tax=Smallanthus sonchifolius TaxID=185202 RepID=A0ACB9FZ61_9ASTR|nr:hypothetical protein L1987_45842 [Smallanthus sonchifolius]
MEVGSLGVAGGGRRRGGQWVRVVVYSRFHLVMVRNMAGCGNDGHGGDEGVRAMMYDGRVVPNMVATGSLWNPTYVVMDFATKEGKREVDGLWVYEEEADPVAVIAAVV